ncbi:universal stress protein [Flavobacterium sp. MFBS3-15]|uniref:universal stress protein n=1 Tax=Flavobacterium sp. MFBS3-15 TaxID=2989816 RepID=UPI0022365605|nr:universal stress protein [Flavobacterium sp. MFBS3-15]MCW4469644.1 universal stress protein [Flavobacterium sp. MFBS3-15]
MKQILFPTDFSEAANTAFIYALRFADSFNAELVILHVYDLPIVETTMMPETATEIFDIVEMNQFESFRDELPKMHKLAETRKLSHVRMRNILLYGDVVYNINKVCKEENIDMVVMGTSGASGLRETFIGSVTASVIANAKVPVLGIPVEADYHPIKSMAFTTQYKDKDNDSLKRALEIADKFGARLQCIYIKNPDDPSDLEEKINEWKAYYRGRNIDFFNIAGNHIEQTLLDFIESQNIGLLVMRAHKRGFFESLFHRSLTKKMAYHTRVPLLVYHED